MTEEKKEEIKPQPQTNTISAKPYIVDAEKIKEAMRTEPASPRQYKVVEPLSLSQVLEKNFSDEDVDKWIEEHHNFYSYKFEPVQDGKQKKYSEVNVTEVSVNAEKINLAKSYDHTLPEYRDNVKVKVLYHPTAEGTLYDKKHRTAKDQFVNSFFDYCFYKGEQYTIKGFKNVSLKKKFRWFWQPKEKHQPYIVTFETEIYRNISVEELKAKFFTGPFELLDIKFDKEDIWDRVN